ncbi:MAG: hypothetical protein ACM31C_13795 [Acidobacteriota bacterium]
MERPLIVVALVAAAALPAGADAPAGDAVTVTPPAQAAGDGRTVVPVTIALPSPRKDKPLPMHDVATVTCSGAAALPGLAKQPPSLLAPAVTRATKLACTARAHGLSSAFQVSLVPPPAGIYATVADSDVRSTAREVHLDAFEWDGTTRSPPASLRASASDGAITAHGGGDLVLALAGNAPRLVAIALADGERLGAVFVPVTGVTTVPVEAERGSKVQFWVAGRWFGPVVAAGRFAKVPIEVPPGITHGVARGTGRAGYVTDAITDLKVPARPRIAAVVAAPAIHIGQQVTIAIAVAGDDGRPAVATAAVAASAQHGALGAVTSLGGGLWSVAYTAPGAPGRDRVTIRVDGDPKAGTAQLDLPIVAGAAARIELVLPPGPFQPGGELAGTLRVVDAKGNEVHDPDVTVALGGTPLAITRGDAIAFRGRLPEHLPASGELPLEISAGGAREHRELPVGGAPASARVAAEVDGRVATTDLVVEDRFGNLVLDGAFEVDVTGAKLAQLSRAPTGFRAALVANDDAASAHLVVRAGGQVLAEQIVRFEPPARAFVLGAWASGGWVDNLGVLASPRGAAGLAIRRGISGVELALQLGAEGMRFADRVPVTIGGVMDSARRTLSAVGLDIGVRGRVRLTRRFGVALGAALVPTRVHVQLAPTTQPADDYVESVLAVRGELQGDVHLGPGRAFLAVDYGRGRLSQGVVLGQIEGLGARVGYEWWFADFGW